MAAGAGVAVSRRVGGPLAPFAAGPDQLSCQSRPPTALAPKRGENQRPAEERRSDESLAPPRLPRAGLLAAETTSLQAPLSRRITAHPRRSRSRDFNAWSLGVLPFESCQSLTRCTRTLCFTIEVVRPPVIGCPPVSCRSRPAPASATAFRSTRSRCWARRWR